MSQGFPQFRPHPLVRGGDLQTVVGCYLPYRKVAYRAVQHRVLLADGDTIVLHDDLPPTATAWQPGDSVVMLMHGLGGCHQSGYMQRCSAKLTALGYRVFRMDLRGCGAGFTLARHPIHAGRSDDAAAAMAQIMELCPDSPIHMAAFSMGANIALKLAGELGAQAPVNLASVMAVAPPIELMDCSRNIQRLRNRMYDRSFLFGLMRLIARRQRVVPDALTLQLNPIPRRLFDFDNQFTAPLSGFADAHEYYARASSGPMLKHIAVPTLIVTAANDPIIPVGSFEKASYAPRTKLVITPCGGHLGFIGKSGIDPDRRWLDWRLIEWIESNARESRRPSRALAASGAVSTAEPRLPSVTAS